MYSNIKTDNETNDNICISNEPTNNEPTNNEPITTSSVENPSIIVEKKKRGRKKTIKLDISQTNDTINLEPIVEKKIRKRRSKKDMLIANANKTTDNITSIGESSIENIIVKTRKRRVCKSKKIENNTDENIILNSEQNMQIIPEEKVIKKRGRKPKGGKIINQKLEENDSNNELPNIILHLKCSIRDIKNINTESTNGYSIEQNEIQSYNSDQLTGSEIYIKNLPRNNTPSTSISNSKDSSSHLFKVYDNISSNVVNNTNKYSNNSGSIGNGSGNGSGSGGVNGSNNNVYPNNIQDFYNNVYSSDVNSYSNNLINRDNLDNCDDNDDIIDINKSEKDIWRKINQLKISFHKSDICKNVGGTQRSACFWCTCEFDSPAIYIPKTLTKDVYNVYGCFCSPECAAAFLMNENVDTSTKFERYHLLNLLYGKIYKYEKSIKIAPNPFYLLNKFYGNLTIQEYRKLFQSEQMIYVVNKPLTHILPELYEDNNDFLLNNKIIPNNTVNIRKNKPLKSNIINNAFGVSVGAC